MPFVILAIEPWMQENSREQQRIILHQQRQPDWVVRCVAALNPEISQAKSICSKNISFLHQVTYYFSFLCSFYARKLFEFEDSFILCYNS